MTDTKKDILPEPIVVDCTGGEDDDLLSQEWLIANELGAYASSTVVGCNTRRYHGLLVAATKPPVGRIVALNCLMDQLVLSDEAGGETVFDLAAFEFEGIFSPDGRANLVEFCNGPAATFLYRCGPAEVLKEVILTESVNAVAVRWSLLSGPGGALRIRPFVSLRDFHSLRQAPPDDQHSHQITYLHCHDGIRVEDREAPFGSLHLAVGTTGSARPDSDATSLVRFNPESQWWYRFRYRADIARGQEGFEDLYTPGWFQADLTMGSSVQIIASLADPVRVNFDADIDRKRRRMVRLTEAVGSDSDVTTRRLASACDVFIVSRGGGKAVATRRTIVAGYHWFADWGRDAMIALAGLGLETGRYEDALGVLRTFATAVDEGMIPNCFDDYGAGAHFNSIDASLWFIVAADRYVRVTGDEAAWRNEFSAVVDQIIRAYWNGARFGIRAGADGLLVGGDSRTQLTWMDAKVAGEPVTPRWGKCVEINALWHEALRITAERCDEPDRALVYTGLADRAAAAFEETFWNEQAGCLYDCVNDDGEDASIRPNQIFAVSGPHSLLSPERRRSVVEVVQIELLTPFGLRTLSPKDPAYCGRYAGSPESRDGAYHQGTVWPWLMGPFIEAYLKIHDFSPAARRQGRQWLSAFDEHIEAAGVGFISEVFDGDPPHNPGGCIAQAWSVAEVLRAKRLVADGRKSG